VTATRTHGPRTVRSHGRIPTRTRTEPPRRRPATPTRTRPARHRTPMERTTARPRRVRAPHPRRRSRFQAGSPRRRLIVAFLVVTAILIGIIVRVGFLQTAEADTLRSAGVDQWTRSIQLPAQRGTVFDRHGNELAMSVPAATISINPKLIENGPATVQLLDDLLGPVRREGRRAARRDRAQGPGLRLRAPPGRCGDRRSARLDASRRRQRRP
jgi:cell division protein FtsI (penicillin-binding protein 3)